ncbi:hypothetical protein QE152_g4570 [Popillia japonica]|uniref:Uncharacterized protein n=1 Tax=Popillia japonica TaxID=7064 RepID=A0AAW1N0F0_POPJA
MTIEELWQKIKTLKLFYHTLKKLRKQKKVKTVSIKNKAGAILTKPKDVLDRWREYFEELQDEEIANTSSSENETEKNDEREAQEHAANITEEEFTEALKKIKNGKSPGHDKITAD